MIKNERQYRITRSQADRFAEAIHRLSGETAGQPRHDVRLLQIQQEALRSQLHDLEEEIREYETLKAGDFAFEQLDAISDLPKLLISARIASGLSQRELADRLGLKEQQIQRYEASDYASASLTRIGEVVSALGLNLDEVVVFGERNISLEDVVTQVSAIGLAPEFIRRRLFLGRGWQSGPVEKNKSTSGVKVMAVVRTIARIFEWSPRQIVGGEAPPLLDSALEGVRFKIASNADPQRVSAYTVYAHYLALLTMQACSDSTIKPIPTDPGVVRASIESRYGSLSLAAVVNYLWDIGIAVLPLDDPGGFHGACFREGGRNVIVLKQQTASCSRWVFDCLHEYWHTTQEPELPERTLLELDENLSYDPGLVEETTASRFAGAVLLETRGQELAEMSLVEAQNDLRQLKTAVQRVAERENVPVDSLANYLAFRLSHEQGENWWGAANSLQKIDDPWNVVRDVFFERADFTKLAEPDRDILAQALAPWENVARV